MKRPVGGLRAVEYAGLTAALVAVFLLCVCVGSVNVPLAETVAVLADALAGRSGQGVTWSVIVAVRVPRVICAALVGGALSLCGAAMQGLLRNPLADGSTLGVSAGASLGAVLAIAFGLTLPGLPGSGTMLMAMLFALLSLLCILGLAHRLDYSMATNSIILIGVIFSMFASSLISLVVTFAGEKTKSVIFWTMGSLADSGYTGALVMGLALLVFGGALCLRAGELNAFAMGEDNARHVGVDVRRVKLWVLVAVSALIGVAVSIGGSIGFVGLVMPHIARMLVGPNHRRLLPASLFLGGIFLMLADLVSRTLLSPRELPIGVVTSLIGAVVFVYIFYTTRKAEGSC